MKVKIDFFCSKEKKDYKKGDDYTGKRTDIGHLLEQEKKVLKPKGENKNAAPKKTAKK